MLIDETSSTNQKSCRLNYSYLCSHTINETQARGNSMFLLSKYHSQMQITKFIFEKNWIIHPRKKIHVLHVRKQLKLNNGCSHMIHIWSL